MQFNFSKSNSCLIFASQFVIHLFLIRKVGSRRSHMIWTLNVYITMLFQVSMLRSVEYCDERMGKEAPVVHFEFPSRLFFGGRHCVTFTVYRGVMGNKQCACGRTQLKWLSMGSIGGCL